MLVLIIVYKVRSLLYALKTIQTTLLQIYKAIQGGPEKMEQHTSRNMWVQ